MKEKKISLASVTSDFKELVISSDVFVDKTLLIKEILEAPEKAILITRPRRWGKSINLDMLKVFLNIEVDESGVKLPVNPSRVFFEGGIVQAGSHLGVPQEVRIAKSKLAQLEDGKYLVAQGRFPVISISFKDVEADTCSEVETRIKEKITGVFEQHNYLRNSPKLIDLQKEKLEECLRGKFERVSLRNSIKFLSEILYKHHGVKVYILVDEYDKPVNSFLEKSFTENIEERTEVAKLVTSIMSACGKDNDNNLEKIIITGILDAFKKYGSSGFSNVKVFGIQNIGFTESFGFSEIEVDALISKLSFGASDSIVRSNIRAWYNGYNVAIIGGPTIRMYTPWSVMNYLISAYLRDCFVPESYWIESGVDEILDNLSAQPLPSELLEKLKALTYGKSVRFPLGSDFHLLRKLTDDNSIEELIAYLLLSSGYITKNREAFEVPNNEVLHYFSKQVVQAWIDKEIQLNKLGNKDVLLKEISMSLSNAEEFKKKVQELILDKVNDGEKTEAYFQSIVGGVIELYAIHKGSGATHHVLAEKTIRLGRIDNIFYPIELDAPACIDITCAGGARAACSADMEDAVSPYAIGTCSTIIHEYKKLDKTALGELSIVLDNAMWQILEKGYLAEPLSKKEVPHKHRWNSIKMRSVVFIRDESCGKWSMDIIEKELGVEQAKILHKFFSDKLVRAELDMSNKKRKPEESRERFLNTLNKVIDVEKLDNLRTLINIIIAPESLILHNLRKSKLVDTVKDKSKLDEIILSIFEYAHLPAVSLSAKIKEEHKVDIPIDKIKSLVDESKKRPLPATDEPSIAAMITTNSGLILRDVPGDGSCFFHAVERQLAKIGSGAASMNHMELRQFAVNYVRGHREEFADFIIGETPEHYIVRMERNYQWADHIIIKALAMELGINIVILEPRAGGGINEPIVITRNSPPFDRSIFLYHAPEIHYQSIETMDTASSVLLVTLGILRARGIVIAELFERAVASGLACAAGAGAEISTIDAADEAALSILGSGGAGSPSGSVTSGSASAASWKSTDAGDAARTSADGESYRPGGAVSSSGAGSSSDAALSATEPFTNTTVMCVPHIIYDRPILNDNARYGGQLFKAAFKVGGIDLVTALMEQEIKCTPKALHILEYIDRTGQIVFSFDSVSVIGAKESLAQPALHLKPVETAEMAVARESAADPLYMPFIDLIKACTQTAALFDPWQLTGKIMHLIQEMVESTFPELQTDAQHVRLSFLYDLLDYVGSVAPVVPPYFPYGPGGPDDFGGGGGDDKKPDSGDNGFGGMLGSHSDVVNSSVAGGADDINNAAW